ncbi:aminotransferase-like domain-containing protein [Oceanirhabdus sp. W0125-5]|uniref:aminotransferase-like domain-containing protein n=1 Tax=Oceanirhabdus sp. W0125-5 TaxID=2999116 RepID=UPI0022F30E3B|nr:PLP-dependent aminotransferase family protein [Oceanirhabdus sp. W0125-5]WBW94989.1 PLP-dependent aminotransferase family protein [Oceanirhabdus sp. W0125-5]
MIINWKPNRDSDKSLYNQIYNYIINQISNGDWYIDSRLPSERKLAEAMEVNRSTISNVLDELKSEGVLISRGSKGTFVANNTWSILASISQPNWKKYLDQGIHKPNQTTIQMINKYEFEDGMIRLGTGEISSELFPSEYVNEIMSNLPLNSLNYEEPLGYKPLREAICKYLSKFDIQLKPEQVLIVSGSLQALSLISIGLLQPGSTVFVEKPSYLKSLHIFQSAGMKLKEILMDEDGIDLNDLRKKLNKSGTNMLYTIPTFHNPTGIVMNESKRKQLMEIIKEFQLPVIEDDAYADLWFSKAPPKPLKSMDDSGSVLYTGTLSKSFSPGLRIGWIAGSESVIERLADIKMQTDYGSSSISQLIAYEWFDKGYHERYQIDLKSSLKSKCNLVLELLSTYFSDIAKWEKPNGGFYIWVTLKKDINMFKLFEDALKSKLLINPGYIYDFNENNSIRLSIAYATKSELEYGIKKLSEIIRKYY